MAQRRLFSALSNSHRAPSLWRAILSQWLVWLVALIPASALVMAYRLGECFFLIYSRRLGGTLLYASAAEHPGKFWLLVLLNILLLGALGYWACKALWRRRGNIWL
jgi:hypothetical protein